MKFTMNREKLLNTLNYVSKGISTKTPMPVLTGINIVATKEKLIFTSSNRELSVQVVHDVSSDVVVETEGDCVVPGKYFIEIIKKVDGETIDFTLFEESTIKIISDRSNFTLISLDKTNFPVINFEKSGTPVVMSSTLLKEIIKQTAFAAGTSESRIVLTGVCFELTEETLKVVATDSFRLARKVTKAPKVEKPIQINIPSKALDELAKTLEGDSVDVELYIISNKALFKFNNVSFMTRLIEGTFPDTSSLFPNKYVLEIEFNKEDLMATVDRAALFTGMEVSSVIKMQLNSDNSILISSNSTEIGRVVDQITPIKVIGSNSFQVAFSSKYFLEALKAFEAKEITIKFTGEIKPFVVTEKDDPDLVQLILPVRIF